MKTFKIVSGKMVITDPCYTLPTWCQGIVENVKNGIWTADVEMDDQSGRVSAIYCYNNEAYIRNRNLASEVFAAPKMPFVVGVDSGQAGFFDLDNYRKDDSIGDSPLADYISDEKDGDKFYAACCACTHNDKDRTVRYGTIPYGAVSSSGYGDGSYNCHGLTDFSGNEYVAFMIEFIGETADDEWDGEGDEEEETD